MEISRRSLGRLALGAGAAATGLVGVNAYTEESAKAATLRLKYRHHGFVFTSGTSTNILTARNRAGHDMIKVVTAWGLPWTANNNQYINFVRDNFTHVIVRTATGDQGPLDANTAANELAPWYWAFAAAGKAGNLIFEIGNEPNIRPTSTPPYFRIVTGATEIQQWSASFKATAGKLRDAFPLARRTGGALAPWTSGYTSWLGNADYKAAVQLCHFFGIHFFGDWVPSLGRVSWDNGWINYMIGTLRGYTTYNGMKWLATEFGLNSNAMRGYDKGWHYADMMHHDAGPPATTNKWGCNLWGGVYYHMDQGNTNGYGNVFPDNGDTNYYNYVVRPHTTDGCGN
ncbi:MAG TPA: hypothetical protein VFC19_48550 [Candidatus Limnocylindrales bacterium]|nr:hypothetical protein [Candidatus Limnocylindrales bacterium]